MKVYEITLFFQSPFGITSRVRGNVYQTFKNILPSTIRGGLLTNIGREYCTNDFKCEECSEKNDCILFKEMENPSLIFHPPVPLCSKCGKKTSIATAFDVRCKICGTRYLINRNDIISAVKGNLLSLIRSYCLNENCQGFKSPGTLEKMRGYLCRKCKESVELTSLKIENVAINKAYGVSEEGLLFSYDTLPEGLTLKCRVVALKEHGKDLIEKIIRNSGEFKVKLGRGKSRGYGHATVKVREIRLEKKYYITDEKVIPLVAESPLATFKVKDSGLYSFPEPPRKIKLPSFTLKSLGLDENVELQIKRHPDYGKLIFSPSKVQVSGWCLRTEMSKIRFTAAAPGTVAIYEAINGKIEDIEKFLQIVELVGLDSLSTAGLNLVYVL